MTPQACRRPGVASRIERLGLALLAVAAPGAGAAQAAYPDKPITIVVPFAAGGPTDRVARDFAEALHRQLGGPPIVIDNTGGAGGTLGTTRVARAAPDGYTLLLHHIGMATSPALYRNLQYRTLDDFAYLGLINEVPMTLIGRPGLPASNYAALVRWIDASKSRVQLATAGPGSASQLCGLLWQSRLKTELRTIAYKGTAPAMSDLLGGQVDLLCDQTTNTVEQIAAGRVPGYAVSTLQRLPMPALAGLPTFDEAGLKDFTVSIWHGLYAPAGTPPAITSPLNAALKGALADPDFQRREAALGAVVVTDARTNGAEHKKFVQAEIAKWRPVIEAAGLTGD